MQEKQKENNTKNLTLFMLQEGIFRRSGVKSRINLLVQNNSSLNNLDHACPYDVADFLKGQFWLLPSF